MKSAAHDFPSRARAGLRNPDLARAMARARTGFIDKRRAGGEHQGGRRAAGRAAGDVGDGEAADGRADDQREAGRGDPGGEGEADQRDGDGAAAQVRLVERGGVGGG